MSPFNIHDEIKLNLNEQTILIKTAASKIVYKELRNRTITPPTAQLKFNTKFVDNVLEWKEIYSLPFRATLDTKSREFQYKLLSRCLVTNAFLFKVGLASARACSFCGDMDESLEHLITSCHYFGQIQSTIMCNGTTAVRICEKNCLQCKNDDEEVYVYV